MKKDSVNLRYTKWDSQIEAIQAFNLNPSRKTDKSWLYLSATNSDVGFSKSLELD